MIITVHGIAHTIIEVGLVGDMDTIHGDIDIGDSIIIFTDIITEIGIIGIILITIIHYMVILTIKEIIIQISRTLTVEEILTTPPNQDMLKNHLMEGPSLHTMLVEMKQK
jgi:hypothetical protein